MNALVEKLHDLIGEFEDDNEIEFDQRITTDSSNLTHNKEPVFEYIELVCKKLTNFALHSYLVKNQAANLKLRNEDMNEITALFLGVSVSTLVMRWWFSQAFSNTSMLTKRYW